MTVSYFFFFFNDTATTEIYTLSLHDALPISTSTATGRCAGRWRAPTTRPGPTRTSRLWTWIWAGSEEHTSGLQSRQYLVCRLLLEKKKTSLYRNERLLIDVVRHRHPMDSRHA